MASNSPPTAAEQQEAAGPDIPHEECFEHAGRSQDGCDVYKCVAKPESGWPDYSVGRLYWWCDEDGWLPLNLAYDARLSRREEILDRSAELAMQSKPASGDEFTGLAESIFKFLWKERRHG